MAKRSFTSMGISSIIDGLSCFLPLTTNRYKGFSGEKIFTP